MAKALVYVWCMVYGSMDPRPPRRLGAKLPAIMVTKAAIYSQYSQSQKYLSRTATGTGAFSVAIFPSKFIMALTAWCNTERIRKN